jgi:hypothetical protein
MRILACRIAGLAASASVVLVGVLGAASALECPVPQALGVSSAIDRSSDQEKELSHDYSS